MFEENRKMKSIDTCRDHTVICCTFLRAANIDLCCFYDFKHREKAQRII